MLDLGAGGGFDCFLAAKRVGPKGQFIVDMTPDRVSKARANAQKLGATNVDFRLGEVEHMPVPAKGHDLRLFALGSDDAVELDTESLREDSAQITFGEIAADVHMQHVALEHEYVPSTRLENRVRLGYLHSTFNTSSGDLLEAGRSTARVFRTSISSTCASTSAGSAPG